MLAPIKELRVSSSEVLVLCPPNDLVDTFHVAIAHHAKSGLITITYVDRCDDQEDGLKVWQKRSMFNGQKAYQCVLPKTVK